nr:Chain P, Fab Fragment Of An Neutralizing Antibody For Type 1 Poliovirus [Human poliovirus 1 Mahoney]
CVTIMTVDNPASTTNKDK